MNLVWPIISQAISHPRRIAVIDDRSTYSYGKLLAGAMFLAEQLDAQTDRPNVGVLLPTSGAFPMALLAGWLAKRVVVPLNYLLAPDELQYVIKDAQLDTIITSKLMLEHLGTEGIPDDVDLLKLEDADFDGFPPLRWPANPSGADLAIILYTSGTSGRPKGVMLTHSNLRSNVDGAMVHAGISEADTFLGVLPQFHSFGMTALTLLPLRIGAKVVYSARFVPRKIVQLIKRHGPDIFMAIPSMYGALLSVKSASADDFKSVRMAVSGGEALPQDTYERFLNDFGVQILEGYGLTETSPVSNWSTPQRNRRHAVGPSLPDVRVIVVDEHNKVVPPNTEGEVMITGPNIMRGYYNLPDETAAVFIDLTPDDDSDEPVRFFRTGDIGKLDEEGYLYITGRKKEMLIIGGENVFPREIEEVLNKHAAVADSAVIGKTDGVRGEVPIAFVEIQEDAEFDETALRAWCRESLAGYKVPREIRHIEALPRNPTGKIMRRKLTA